MTFGEAANPWSQEVFITKNFTSYALMRAMAGKGSGKISSALQISTLLNEFKHILSEGIKMGIPVQAGSFAAYKAKCLHLIKAGLLSNAGRPKRVVGFKDTQNTIKALLNEDHHRDPVYTIQLCALTLMLLYAGVRFGSIIPPAPEMASEWHFLKWKNIKIYRCKRDSLGDRFHCVITFTHMKAKTNVIRVSDHIHRHIFSSPSSTDRVSMDLALFLMALGLQKGVFDIESFEEWYLSDLAILPVHKERLEEAVICMSSDGGGHNSHLTNQVWTGDAANKAVQKAFRKGEAAFPVTGYCLRRNFVQALQQFGDRQQTARIIGHKPMSSVQDTSYRSDYGEIDLVQIVSDGVFRQSDGYNPYVAMLRTALTRTDCRLTTEEYHREVAAKCQIEIQEFTTFKTRLKEKHGPDFIAHVTEEDRAKFKSLQRAMINAKQRAQQKAFKEKYLRMLDAENVSLTSDSVTGEISNPRLADTSQPATEDENSAQASHETDEEELMIVDDMEEDDTSEGTPQVIRERSEDDIRYKFVLDLMNLPKAIQGTNPCLLCEDPEDEENDHQVLYEGHNYFMDHMFSSFRSASWTTYRSRNAFYGPHTHTYRFRKEHPPTILSNGTYKCPFNRCTKSWEPGNFKNSRYNQHLHDKHMDDVHDLSFEEAFQRVQNYVREHMNVEITYQQWMAAARRWQASYDNKKNKTKAK